MADDKNPKMPWEGSLGIGRQSAQGTAVAATLFFPISEDTCRRETTLHESGQVASWPGGSASREQQSTPAVVVKQDDRIGFKCEPRFAHLLLLLPWVLGADAGGSEYVPGTAEHWLTVESDKIAEGDDGKSVEQYSDGVVSSLTLESSENGSLVVTVEGVACAKTTIAGTAVDWSDWETKPPLMHHNLTISTDGRPAWLPPNMVYSLSLELSAGVEEEHFGNGLTRIAGPSGKFTGTGTLSIPWNDETVGVRAVLEAGTRFDLHAQYAGYGEETFELQLSCKPTGAPVQITSSEGLKCEVAFKCVQTSATHAVKAVFGS